MPPHPRYHIVWFRNDLRLHDHQPLHTACERAASNGDAILPIYIFDELFHGQTRSGLPRTGGFRRKFLAESLSNLREKLRAKQSDLLLFNGEPFRILSELAAALPVAKVHAHKHYAHDERQIETRVEQSLSRSHVPIAWSSPQTLLHEEDLPFSLSEVPKVFTKFRRIVEKNWYIRDPLPAPEQIPFSDAQPTIGDRIASGEPILEQSLVADVADDSRAPLEFRGGEAAGLHRMQDYLWNNDCLRNYKQTRNGMLGADYSSKFSPWLAHGCLSARAIHAQVQAYERQRVANDSTYWLIFELLWRDYFAFIAGRAQAKLFRIGGLKAVNIPWSRNQAMFDAWRHGQTGYPLIDANMRELAATGFMSNRGRQNVASFLTKNLGLDWRLGAEWFESLLIDYDPASNYGNWNYIAGIGNDAREFRWFNTTKQSRDYDPQGAYLKHWLPELAAVPSRFIHEPWTMNDAEQRAAHCILGSDYPRPIVDLFASAKQNERRYLKCQ